MDYENSKSSQIKLSEMIKGEKKTTYIPKPGEFITHSTDKQLDKYGFSEIPLKELLDGTKTYSELKSKFCATKQSDFIQNVDDNDSLS